MHDLIIIIIIISSPYNREDDLIYIMNGKINIYGSLNIFER